MKLETLLSIPKEEMDAAAQTLNEGDVAKLVQWLNETTEEIRYKAFLLLKSRSAVAGDVYPYWDEFTAKITSNNSFFRTIGLVMMAANARWDTAGRMEKWLSTYLSFCDDEKPMVVRLCIQSLAQVVPYKPYMYEQIIDKLLSIDLSKRKDTQQKLLLQDILGILIMVNKIKPDERIQSYIADALTGGLLSAKEKKAIQAKMNMEEP